MVCHDGTRLASSIWTPEADGPWPVLLMRQPYGRAIASTVTYAHPSWYARQGFLVVVQDVRGRGASEGSFAGFAQEAADGAAAVRWARQLDGGNGRVGTYGFSYQGLTQLLMEPPGQRPGRTAASAADPFPDCLAPAMCGLDERLHWASEGGAHWWALGVGWALQLAAEGCRRRQDADWLAGDPPQPGGRRLSAGWAGPAGAPRSPRGWDCAGCAPTPPTLKGGACPSMRNTFAAAADAADRRLARSPPAGCAGSLAPQPRGRRPPLAADRRLEPSRLAGGVDEEQLVLLPAPPGGGRRPSPLHRTSRPPSSCSA
jgi:hypothetical protein